MTETTDWPLCTCEHDVEAHTPHLNGKPMSPGRCFRVDCDCEKFQPIDRTAEYAALLRRVVAWQDNPEGVGAEPFWDIVRDIRVALTEEGR